MGKIVKCLDKGYIRLVDVMGDDNTITNAARVSFDKEADKYTEEQNERLIAFLAREGHDSPFRHAVLQFEVYAPMMITRQWEKYLIGSNNSEFGSRNESSRRYITEDEEFYVPKAEEWRSYPDNVKQGSGEPVDEGLGHKYEEVLREYIGEGELWYKNAIEDGIAPEQARLFLPAYGLYVRFRWTATLQTVAHLIRQRTADDAQYEFRLYAESVRDLAEEHFPVALPALLEGGRG